MNYQEGFLLDRITVRVGVAGIGQGSAAHMVAQALDHFLNKRGRVRVFRKEKDRYVVTEEPQDPEDQDVMVGVIDPLPSSLEKSKDRILELKSLNTQVVWLLNRKNAGVDLPGLYRFLGFHPDHIQEEVPYETICRAEYGMYELCEMTVLEGIKELADRIEKDYGPR